MGSEISVKLKQLYYNWLVVFTDFKKQLRLFLTTLSACVCFTIIIVLGMEFAFHLADINARPYFTLHSYILYFFIIDNCIRITLLSRSPWTYFIVHPTEVLAFIPLVALVLPNTVSLTFFGSQIVLLILLLGRLGHLQHLLNWLKVKPAQIIILGFIFVIFIGSLLLSLPIASAGSPLSYVDALFTACSAVCVTGLVVNNVGADFSFFGQLIILFLIQIGGLGIMSFSVLLAMILKRKLTQADSIRLQENYATVNIKETFSAISFIFKFTLFFECIGAVLLALAWHRPGHPYWDTLFTAIFHSVSAFCNAGFSLFDTNLIAFQTHVPTVLIISILIIFGGLGFPVLFNMFQRYTSTQTIPFKMQTKLAVMVTLFLIIGGTALIYFTELHHTLSGKPLLDQLQIAYFQSVTARTAGFNTIDINMFHSSTIMVLLVLMFVGASPGSTGGGIKTTTFGLIMISFWNILRNSFRFDFGHKTIDSQSVLKAFATVLVAAFLILVFSFFLVQFESLPIQSLLFEVVSAFGTVGLSLGITSHLSVIGKGIIIVVMFIGRIGPFAFLYAFVSQQTTKPYAYPVEKVNIV